MLVKIIDKNGARYGIPYTEIEYIRSDNQEMGVVLLRSGTVIVTFMSYDALEEEFDRAVSADLVDLFEEESGDEDEC